MNKDVLRLVRLGNQCLINDRAPMAPRFDEGTANIVFEEDEYVSFRELLHKSPPEIQFYRSHFFAVEYKEVEDTKGIDRIALMKDERGEIHTMFARGKVIYTKEL